MCHWFTDRGTESQDARWLAQGHSLVDDKARSQVFNVFLAEIRGWGAPAHCEIKLSLSPSPPSLHALARSPALSLSPSLGHGGSLHDLWDLQESHSSLPCPVDACSTFGKLQGPDIFQLGRATWRFPEFSRPLGSPGLANCCWVGMCPSSWLHVPGMGEHRLWTDLMLLNSHQTSLSLRFLSCKMGLMMVPTSHGCNEEQAVYRVECILRRAWCLLNVQEELAIIFICEKLKSIFYGKYPSF